MPGVHDHHAFVSAWMDTAPTGASTVSLLARFERGLGAIWARAHITLGEVTLTAILDRVVHDAAEAHPFVTGLTVGPGGLQLDGLRAAALPLPPDVVAAAAHLVLAQLLTVLGNLTAEILTPALHAALAGSTDGKDVP